MLQANRKGLNLSKRDFIFPPTFCRINNRPSVRQHILTNFSYDLKKLYKTTNKKLLKGLILF